MSLVALACRVIAGKLVKGNTMAGDNVIISPFDPIVEVAPRVASLQAPLIVLAEGDAKAEKVQGRDLSGSSTTVDLFFSLYVGPSTTLDLPSGEVKFGQTGEGAFTVLQILAHQVTGCLQHGEQPWLDLWNKFVVSYEVAESGPILEITEKSRSPALELHFRLCALPHPKVGQPIQPYWAEFLAAVRNEPDIAPLGDILEAALVGRPGLPEWREFQYTHGLSNAAMRATGLAPVDPTETGEPAELQQGDFDNTFETGTPPL